MEYIDTHREEFGVEPICRELQVAPSTHYAAKARRPSARAVADGALSEVIAAEHAANYGVSVVRKMRRHLTRLGHPVARCTVERLMRAGGLCGVVRGGFKRTTIPAKEGCRAGGLVNRAFTAAAPDELLVADCSISDHCASVRRRVREPTTDAISRASRINRRPYMRDDLDFRKRAWRAMPNPMLGLR